jgi:hypothetical protein
MSPEKYKIECDKRGKARRLWWASISQERRVELSAQQSITTHKPWAKMPEELKASQIGKLINATTTRTANQTPEDKIAAMRTLGDARLKKQADAKEKIAQSLVRTTDYTLEERDKLADKLAVGINKSWAAARTIPNRTCLDCGLYFRKKPKELFLHEIKFFHGEFNTIFTPAIVANRPKYTGKSTNHDELCLDCGPGFSSTSKITLGHHQNTFNHGIYNTPEHPAYKT